MGTGTNIGSLFWSTGIDTTGLNRDSKKAQGALSGLFKPSLIGAAALAAGLYKVGDAALSFSRDFETAFAEVQTISESARNNAESMKESLLELTTKIPVQAIDATKALYQIVSAGFDGAEAMSVLEISAKAAIAGVSTTAIAADTLTTIINAYGLSADEATNVSDALFKTVELGKTTLGELGASFSQVAGLGAAYKIELTDILAATAQLTSQGASTSEAITRIRGGIVALSKEFGPAVFEGRNLAEAFQFARDEADKAGKGYEEFFGRVEAVVGILGLTGDQLDNYNKKLGQVNEASGSTEKALGEMTKTFDSQYQLLKNNVTVAFSGFGDLIKNTLTPIIRAFNDEFETGSQRTEKQSKKTFESIIEESKKLATSEEKRAFIIQQISDLQKEAEQQQQNINKLQSDQPGILRRNLELLNQAVGLGADFTAGIDNEKLLQFTKEQQTAIINSKKLLADYFKTIKDESANLEGLGAEELEKLRGSLENALTLGFGENVNENIKKQIESVNNEIKRLKNVEIPITLVNLETLDKELKQLKENLNKATAKEAPEIFIKIKVKETEIDNFITNLEQKFLSQRNITGLNIIPSKTTPELTKGLDPMKEIVKSTNLEFDKLNKKIKEGAKLAKQLQSELDTENAYKLAENFQDASQALGDLSSLISKFDEGLGSAVQSASELAGGISNVIAGLASGNPFQVISGIAQGIAALITTKEISDTGKYEKAIILLTDAYKSLNFEIDKALGEERITSRDAAIKNIEAQIKAINDLIKAEEESIKIIRFLGIFITERSNTDQEAIESYKRQIEDLNRDIQQILIDTTELITGTTGEALANSLVDAFQIGENAAKEFGDVVNDVLSSAVKDALSRKFLEQPLQDAIDQLGKDLTDSTGDGFELTKEEAAKFKDQVTSIGEVYANALESIGSTLGIDFGTGQPDTDTGISGAIRRELTEETGGLILGQFTAMRIDLKHLGEIGQDQSEILNESSGYLANISRNTENNTLIPSLLDELKQMNTNLKTYLG